MRHWASPIGFQTKLTARIATVALLAVGCAAAHAQAWVDNYAQGLKLAKSSDWPMARQAFLNANRSRGGDASEATRLPGPITEPRVWRGGAPYSPKFAAAYCAWRWALETSDSEDRRRLLTTTLEESSALLKSGQRSSEAYALVMQSGALLRDEASEAFVRETWIKNPTFNWKVDTEVVTPEDKLLTDNVRAQLQVLVPAANQTDSTSDGGSTGTQAQPPKTEIKPDPKVETKPETKPEVKPPAGQGTRPPRANPPGAADTGTGQRRDPVTNPPVANAGAPGTITAIKASDLNQQGAPTGEIAPLETKFALILGTSQSRLAETRQPFGAGDAALMRQSLIEHAGYPEANIETLTDPTAEQIKIAAESLAERMPSGATLFLFYSGGAINLGGVDYLAGSDTASLYETGSMVRKDALLSVFTRKGAKIFSFYQVARPTLEGRVFGSQVPTGGSISQMLGTLEGEAANSVFVDGHEVGIFALGITKVLEQLRSNSIPITEFAWQVFYSMRGGKAGLGAIQTPTLPVLILLESDSRF